MLPIRIPIRVQIPAHLQTLARHRGELTLDVPSPPTVSNTLDALEQRFPQLCGTIRDHVTRQRRPFLRFFACNEDISHQPTDIPLPPAVASGQEPLLVIGAIAGG